MQRISREGPLWAVLVWLAMPSAAVAEEPVVLRLGACGSVPAEALAAALDARLGHPVEVGGGSATDGPAEVWTLDVAETPDDALLTLHAPDGSAWDRTVPLEDERESPERVRAVALAAEYLLTLAQAPFLPAVGPPPPAVPLPPEAPAVPLPPEAPAVPLPPEAPPEVVPAPASAEPGGVRIGAELLVGGGTDLGTATRGGSGTVALGLRPALEWPWGLWVHLEAAWQFREADEPEPLQLHVLPLRVGVGAVIRPGPWFFRLAFQGIVEAWWSLGGTARSGWRSGGGMLVSGGWAVLEWLSLGADLGADLLPHGIELIYGDLPVFSLGQWRWRGFVWAAVGWDAGV